MSSCAGTRRLGACSQFLEAVAEDIQAYGLSACPSSSEALNCSWPLILMMVILMIITIPKVLFKKMIVVLAILIVTVVIVLIADEYYIDYRKTVFFLHFHQNYYFSTFLISFVP